MSTCAWCANSRELRPPSKPSRRIGENPDVGGPANKRRTQRYNEPVPVSRCRVSYTDTEGICHAVEVDAESLYEAVALAVAEFRDGEIMTDLPSPMAEFTVLIIRRPIEHRIRFKRVQEWAQPSTKGGPAAAVKREKIRKIIDS